jgi:hypothetical protein
MKTSLVPEPGHQKSPQTPVKAGDEKNEITLRAEIHDPELSIGMNFNDWKTYQRERDETFEGERMEISFVKGPPEARALFEAMRPDDNNVKSYFDTWDSKQENARARDAAERTHEREGKGGRSM